MLNEMTHNLKYTARDESAMVYEAVNRLQPNYSRVADGDVTSHEFVNKVGDAVVVAECRFNRNATTAVSRGMFTIEIREPGRLLAIDLYDDTTKGISEFLELDPEVKSTFDKLYEVFNQLKLDERQYFDNLEANNSLTGLNGQLVEVDGIRFASLLPRYAGLPIFAQRLVTLDNCDGRSGRQVCLLARQARELLSPELADIEKVNDLYRFIDDLEVIYDDGESMAIVDRRRVDEPWVVDNVFGVDGFAQLNVVTVNGRPLVLSNRSCETVSVVSQKVDKSLASFASTAFAKARKQKQVVDSLLGNS